MTTDTPYQPSIGMNVLAPLCYLGIDEDTPLGFMPDVSFNQISTVGPGITPLELNVSCSDPWFLHSIYVFAFNGTVFVKPFDGDGQEIWTDFELTSTGSTDPFPLLIPKPFRPNDILRYQVLSPAGATLEVSFRGYTLGPRG